MKPLTYKITRSYDESTVSSQIEVDGVILFELYGYQWAAHPDEQEIDPHAFVTWIVDEVSTGCELVSSKTLLSADDAKEWAWKYLGEKGYAMTRFHVEKARMKLQEYEAIRN
jgi:hypothetical protein